MIEIASARRHILQFLSHRADCQAHAIEVAAGAAASLGQDNVRSEITGMRRARHKDEVERMAAFRSLALFVHYTQGIEQLGDWLEAHTNKLTP